MDELSFASAIHISRSILNAVCLPVSDASCVRRSHSAARSNNSDCRDIAPSRPIRKHNLHKSLTLCRSLVVALIGSGIERLTPHMAESGPGCVKSRRRVEAIESICLRAAIWSLKVFDSDRDSLD